MAQAGALPEPYGINSLHAVLWRWRQAFHAVMKCSGCHDKLGSAAVSSGS